MKEMGRKEKEWEKNKGAVTGKENMEERKKRK